MGETRKNVSVSLVLLMGLPGSGKTTLSDKIESAFCEEQEKTKVIQVTYDKFVPLEKQARYLESRNSNAAKILRKNIVKCVQFLVSKLLHTCETDIEDLENILSSEVDDLISRKILVYHVSKLLDVKLDDYHNFLIVIDDNNYYHSMRNDFYQIAKNSRIGFCILYCKSSVRVCCERNLQREEASRVPHEVITEMSNKLEEPNPLENACDVFCVQLSDISLPQGEGDLDKETSCLPLVKTVLKSSLKNPVIFEASPDRTEEIERERKICSESGIHQADQILRKWIHTEITISSFMTKTRKDVKNLGTELNRKKAMVLEKLKSGEFKLLSDVDQDVEFRKEVIALAKGVI